MISPETIQILVTFLTNIGSLAATELRERWKLRRENQGSIDLSQKNPPKEDVGKTVQALLSSQNDADVKRILDLINRKRDLIYDAQRGKLAAEKDFNEQRINRFALELTQERYTRSISEMLAEIENDIKSLGLYLEKDAGQ